MLYMCNSHSSQIVICRPDIFHWPFVPPYSGSGNLKTKGNVEEAYLRQYDVYDLSAKLDLSIDAR